MDIRIVVNNAGIDFLDKLKDLSLKDIIRMVELDSFVVTSTMYLFLDKWVKRNNNNLGK
jgi:short-subunit dehydrogenase